MKISRAMGQAFRTYFKKPYEGVCFMLTELCLTLACFTPLLFWTTESLKSLCLLCVPFYLLLMLPARINAAGVMQDALGGGSLLSVHLVDPEGYGGKLAFGLKQALKLLLWGSPLIAGLLYARTQISGETDAFTLLRAIKAFGGGELMQGGINLLVIAVALILILFFGIAWHSGERHALVLGEKRLLSGHRWKGVGCWLASLITIVPALIAILALIFRYAPALSNLDGLIMGDAHLPDTRTSLIILAVGGVLTIPLMPVRSLMIGAWVRGLKEGKA